MRSRRQKTVDRSRAERRRLIRAVVSAAPARERRAQSRPRACDGEASARFRPAVTSNREYPARPIVGVGAVILVYARGCAAIGWAKPLSAAGVVLVKRRFEPLAGSGACPAASSRSARRSRQASAREIVEETGLIVDVGPIVEVFDRIFRDDDGRVRYHFVLIDYVCRATRRPSPRRIGCRRRHDRRSRSADALRAAATWRDRKDTRDRVSAKAVFG